MIKVDREHQLNRGVRGDRVSKERCRLPVHLNECSPPNLRVSHRLGPRPSMATRLRCYGTEVHEMRSSESSPTMAQA